MAQNEDLIRGIDSVKINDSHLAEKLKSVPKFIITEEGYCKWFCEVENYITESEICKLMERLKEYQYSTTDDTFEYYFNGDFARQINYTLIYILRRNQEKSLDGIEALRKLLGSYLLVLLQKGSVTAEAERLQGVLFAIQSLNILAKVQFECDDFADSLQNLLRFDDLKPPAKAFAFHLKSVFMGEFKPFSKIVFIAANQAIEQDPHHWEWHFTKYQLVRSHRRVKDTLKGHPSLEEKLEIATAYRLNPKDPLCFVRTCQFLAAYLKSVMMNHIIDAMPFHFGEMYFRTEDDVIAFINQKSLELEFKNTTWLMELAIVHQTGLPKHLRDLNMAKSFLSRALALTPNSGRINHQMALLFREYRDYSKAEEYLVKAVALSPVKDLTARVDLVRLLLKNVDENAVKLRKLFETEITVSIWPTTPINVIFLKGYFHYKIGEYEEAIKSWTRAVMLFGDGLDFPKHWKFNFTKLNFYGTFWGWDHLDEQTEVSNIQERVLRNPPTEAKQVNAFNMLVKLVQEVQTSITPRSFSGSGKRWGHQSRW